MAQSGMALQHVLPGLQGDREIVLAAVVQNGIALQYATAELKRDHEIVLAAVKQSGEALEYAASKLQGDRAIVLAAVTQDARSLRFAHFRLQQHPALRWIRTTSLTLHCAMLRLKLATCASLSAPLSHAGCALSALPKGVVEVIGSCISPAVVLSAAVCHYGCWDDTSSRTRKKRKVGVRGKGVDSDG